jgi:hypothetical protein
MGDYFSRHLRLIGHALGGKAPVAARPTRKAALQGAEMMLIGEDLFILSFYWRKALVEAMGGSRTARQAFHN